MHDTPDSHQTTSSQEENREDAMQSGACMVHGAIGAMHQHSTNGIDFSPIPRELMRILCTIYIINIYILNVIFISSVRSSSGYHGLLHTRRSSNPLFQIFQILLQILK